MDKFKEFIDSHKNELINNNDAIFLLGGNNGGTSDPMFNIGCGSNFSKCGSDTKCSLSDLNCSSNPPLYCLSNLTCFGNAGGCPENGSNCPLSN